jgi:hypothetical protein
VPRQVLNLDAIEASLRNVQAQFPQINKSLRSRRENAKAHLDPSTLITETRKHSLVALFRIPKIKRYFAKFLKEQADPKYLIAS